MRETEDGAGRVKELLDDQRFGVLCTCEPGGQPYASLVAFAATPDLAALIFATLRASRKYTNLAAEPRVSMLVDDRAKAAEELGAAAALTALGSASEIAGAERDAAASLLLARHPALRAFVASPGCALLRLAVDRYVLVTRFQQVVEVRPQGIVK
jgi:heme iron utilization protein